jgi:hypothetical protein
LLILHRQPVIVQPQGISELPALLFQTLSGDCTLIVSLSADLLQAPGGKSLSSLDLSEQFLAL